MDLPFEGMTEALILMALLCRKIHKHRIAKSVFTSEHIHIISAQIKIQNTTNSSEVALRSNFTHNLPLRVNIILAFNQHTQVSPGSELYALLCFFSPQIMFVKFNKLIFVITYNWRTIVCLTLLLTVFHCADMPKFIYPFYNVWAFRVVFTLGYYK